MKSSVVLAGATLISLSLLGSQAFAQDISPLTMPAKPDASSPNSATGLAPMERGPSSALLTGHRVSSIIGASVINKANETVGNIDDIIVAADGKAQYAILSVGGFLGVGSRLVAVPFDELSLEANRVTLPTINKERLSTMPEFHYSK